jgi:4-hydroxy 2-oxovalerate aldolase
LQNHIEPLKATVEWGPNVPYNITGQMNLHPRHAIQYLAGDDRDDYVKFYDQVAADI